MASLKELDQRLFENYIELKADPIVGSLEPGIYAGYFDWKDCLPPTGGWFEVTEVSRCIQRGKYGFPLLNTG